MKRNQPEIQSVDKELIQRLGPYLCQLDAEEAELVGLVQEVRFHARTFGRHESPR